MKNIIIVIILLQFMACFQSSYSWNVKEEVLFRSKRSENDTGSDVLAASGDRRFTFGLTDLTSLLVGGSQEETTTAQTTQAGNTGNETLNNEKAGANNTSGMRSVKVEEKGRPYFMNRRDKDGDLFLFPTLTANQSMEYVSECAVFPACDLEIHQNAEQLHSTLGAFTEIFKENWDEFPVILGLSASVTCHPDRVAGIITGNVMLMVLIVTANAIIFFVTLTNKSLRKPHGYFKLSLAAADILIGVVTLPSITANIVRSIHYNKTDINQVLQITSEINKPESIAIGIISITSYIVTVLSILLLSVDSFLSIRWPVKYSIGDLMTVRKAEILIGITWIFGAVVAAIPAMGSKYAEYNLSFLTMSYFPVLNKLGLKEGENPDSLRRELHGMLYVALVWGIPFILTWGITLSTSIYSKAMLNRMENISMNYNEVSKKTLARLNRDILKTVVVVLLLFTATALPISIALILQITDRSNPVCMRKSQSLVFFISIYVLMFGSFINVIVYNVFNIEFRNATKKTFQSALKFCCRGFMKNKIKRKTTKSTTMSKSSKSRLTSLFSKSKHTKEQESSQGNKPSDFSKHATCGSSNMAESISRDDKL